ncbi:hypothetical protein Baya_11256 [Bagarius yarrelli]|uniref:Uncharacterized protein n=1 Tax=Bagarius yarrelli TaxID=175774 RepID=A0A556V075_BAGYA|nr:hypothetical protein Baya_11256 [Bagarius yarrelli]
MGQLFEPAHPTMGGPGKHKAPKDPKKKSNKQRLRFRAQNHHSDHLASVMASGNRERHRVLSLKEETTSDRNPGDTLPWNLSQFQKVRRSKSASAEVLDPAERAVIRIAGTKCLHKGHWAGPGV